MDALFYVNVGLVVVFFSFFGSRFVLAPGLGVDFQMPEMAGPAVGVHAAECVISVGPSGQIFADGLLNMAQLREWLRTQAKGLKDPSLLVRTSGAVHVQDLTQIVSAAHAAGFARVVVGVEESAADATAPRVR